MFSFWGPLGAKVAQKPSPRTTWKQFDMASFRFLTDLRMSFDDFWKNVCKNSARNWNDCFDDFLLLKPNEIKHSQAKPPMCPNLLGVISKTKTASIPFLCLRCWGSVVKARWLAGGRQVDPKIHENRNLGTLIR